VVYSVTESMSRVRSISLRIESLVTRRSAGGVVVALVVVTVLTSLAIGLVIQPMNRIKSRSIGRVGIMALTQVRIKGLILSPAEVMKNLSGTAQSTGRHPKVGGFCLSLRRGQVSAKPAEQEHRRYRAVLQRTNGVDEGGNNATIFVALLDTTIFVVSGIVSRETMRSLGFWSGRHSVALSNCQLRGSMAIAVLIFSPFR